VLELEDQPSEDDVNIDVPAELEELEVLSDIVLVLCELKLALRDRELLLDPFASSRASSSF
jgi:hypothetical protein